MYPNQFTYHRAGSVAEAIQLLQSNPEAKIVAGGHSLIPAMKLRLAMPGALVDISKLDELRGIRVNGGATIGAMTTYRELLDSQELVSRYPIIQQAVSMLGDPAVRNLGTVGGSLAHSDPAADLTAVMLALGASVKVGPSGERTISTDDLFVDLLTTSLEPEEVLTEITIPEAGNAKMAYKKHAHPASGYAVVGVAVVVRGNGGNTESARIAVTGATTKATRSTRAEEALGGKPLNEESIAAAAGVAAVGLELNGDIYALAEYRAQLIKVLTKRALTEALAS